MKRFILFIFTILYAICLFPQKKVVVNARIETEHQVWTLDSIKLNDKDTSLYWHVESKGYTWCQINPDSYLEDYTNKTRYYLKSVEGLALKPDSTILEDLEIIHFVEKFESIPCNIDNIDYYANKNFYIKKIDLYVGQFMQIPQHKRYTKTEQDSIELSQNLFEHGMLLHENKEYKKAIEVFSRVSIIDSLLFCKNTEFGLYNKKCPFSQNYAKQWIANCYYKLGEDSLAKTFYVKYKTRIPFDRKLVMESDSLIMKYPEASMKPGNKGLYINIYKYRCDLDSINLGKNNSRYIESLRELASIYKNARMYNMSNLTYLSILNKLSQDDYDYQYIIYNIASNYYSLGDYPNAVKFMEKFYKIRGHESLYFSDAISGVYRSQLISSYMEIGMFEKAIEIMKNMIIKTKEKQVAENVMSTLDYNNAISDYAAALSRMGNQKEALRQYKKINSSFIHNLDIGDAYLNTYNYEKAEEFYLKNITNNSNIDSLFNVAFGSQTAYSKLAILEYRRGNIKKAINYQLKDIVGHIRKIKNSEASRYWANHNSIITMMSNLSLFYLLNNQIDASIELENQNINYKSKFYPIDHYCYAYSYINIGEAYLEKKEFEKALEYSKLGYNLLTEKSLDTRRVLTNLVKINNIINNKNEAEKYLLELNRINIKRIKGLFTELTHQEKKRFLDKDIRFYSNFLPKYSWILGSDTLKKVLYDGVLLSKGALLSSDIGLRKIIENSKDLSLLEDYYQLQFFKRSIIKEMENRGNETIIDSLSNIANELEDSLIIHSKEYGNYMQKQSINWKDIRQRLSAQSIAIEFINFELKNNDVIYAALVVKNNYSYPKFIELCNSTSLEKLSIRDLYLTSTLDNLIWEPLKEELSNVDNIYFSPSGLLHNIAIELTPSMRKKNLYRLSSTRELVITEQKHEKIKKAALFGGMKYNSKLDNQPEKYEYSSLNSTRGLEEFPDRGLLYSELPLTGAEINNAKSYLKRLKFECLPFVGKEGIEESFKSLSGKGFNWIHVATHGGYMSPTKTKENTMNCDFIIELDKDIFSEDISLTHSFLVFSGGNSALKGDTIPENTEDGILTAQEISQLDLNNLELVILSACKTGLGKISEEGVYGLQRGFKKAGAKSILMSLWDVNDKATYDYMSLFYRFYSKANNIKYAYDMAQRTIREKYPNNPEYWAAFILLDGV